MGFSDEDRILMNSLYVFKGRGAKILTTEFPTKGWGLQRLNKRLKKLRETGTTAIDEAATLKEYRISLFFYSVIFIHKLDIVRNEYVIWLQIFSAATLPNIINTGPSNHKNKG